MAPPNVQESCWQWESEGRDHIFLSLLAGQSQEGDVKHLIGTYISGNKESIS